MVGPLSRALPRIDWLPRPLRAKATLGNLAVDAPAAFCRSVAVLNDEQKQELRKFFYEWGKLLRPALVPGAHVCVAGHPILQYLVQVAMADALRHIFDAYRGQVALARGLVD